MVNQPGIVSYRYGRLPGEYYFDGLEQTFGTPNSMGTRA
jgi:hypothetical protein